jgi:hypothetical protein
MPRTTLARELAHAKKQKRGYDEEDQDTQGGKGTHDQRAAHGDDENADYHTDRTRNYS